MSNITIGIVDYGMGNHASVAHSLRELGFRVRISKNPDELNLVDALVLPGVGAYPMAMRTLHEQGLVTYLQEQAHLQRPLIGICLGMQLLASASFEHEYTTGLDLIPGEIVPFAGRGWHIGWNTLEYLKSDSLFKPSNQQSFYFNHSFHYEGPIEYQLAITQHTSPFASVIRHGSVVGMQFHPEKSQLDGRELLKNIITGLVHA